MPRSAHICRTAAAALMALVLAGCEARRAETPIEKGKTPAPPAHDMSAMRDSAAADSGGMAGMDHSAMQNPGGEMADSGGMAGMQHGDAAGKAGAAAGGHARMPGMQSSSGAAGMDHSQMQMGGARRTAGAAQSGMAGMDHSQMQMGGARRGGGAARGGMAGMDHGQMAGRRAGGRAQGMAGMDHGNMNLSAGTRRSGQPQPMAGMDHGNMQMGAPAAGQRPAAAMDHANMPGMQPGRGAAQQGRAMAAGQVSPLGSDSAGAKLRELVAALVRDPAVQAEIQRDSVLRNRWSDRDVRQLVVSP